MFHMLFNEYGDRNDPNVAMTWNINYKIEKRTVI